MIDETHDPKLTSWVESANGHADFPIQNLPIGVFTPPNGGGPRGGVAIGDRVLDLGEAITLGLLSRDVAGAAAVPSLNGFLALGAAGRIAVRQAVQTLLRADGPHATRASALGDRLTPQASACSFSLPADIGDYTDFYAGINHAVNVGRLFRLDAPLLPNYKHVPIAYHSRASSIRVSGEPVRRPLGQSKAEGATKPGFGPCKRLDMELELGVWVGPGNALGEPVSIGEAAEHIAGYSLLNDWSARDLQAWEYQPLGPFLAKSFLSTLSPWIITPEALAPFRIPQAPRPKGDPKPLPYLWDEADQKAGAIDLQLEVWLTSAAMRDQDMAPLRLALSNVKHLYWTTAQMLAHHTSNGCNLRPGDLLGTGTISGPTPDSQGSLLEISEGGAKPFTLPTLETRTFLADGDEVTIRGHCARKGYASIGFGECRGRIV
jgi:fumarylacetoacetase